MFLENYRENVKACQRQIENEKIRAKAVENGGEDEMPFIVINEGEKERQRIPDPHYGNLF